MELRTRLTRWALARPHVLLVAAPGSTALRWDVEASLRQRGWSPAASPADADLLLIAGEVGHELGAAVDLLWSQVPRPRHRTHVADSADLERGLDDAVVALLADLADDADDMGADVAGLPMADVAADRDGLDLDTLTIHLGPVLAGWPAGLVVSGSLQGDVLSGVEARVLDAHAGIEVLDHAGAGALHALDGLERFAVVAGWTAVARDAAWLRASLRADPEPAPATRQRARRLLHRLRTSRTLRWSARDLRGTLERVHRWCDVVGAALDGDPRVGAVEPVPLADLPSLLGGLDLGSARLVITSLPLDLAATRDTAGDR